MEPTVKQVYTKEVKAEKKPRNSQRTLIIILLVCLILSLGGLTYFLIKDEILQIPFVNIETEEEEEVFEDQTETKEFSISYSTDPDSTKYYLKTKLPEDAGVLGEDTTSTKIEFSNSYLKFSISHITVAETVKSYVEIDEGKLFSLFRVIDQSDHIYYTSNLRTDEDCVEVGAVAPCGSLAVELDNDNNEIVYISVEFVGDNEDFAIADDIVSNLEFVSDKTTEAEGSASETAEEIASIEEIVEEDPTADWLTYTLDNPIVSFKYPSGYSVNIVPTGDDDLIHLLISGARESFNYYFFYGEGGPGSGNTSEIKPPDSIRDIGEFLGQEVTVVGYGEVYHYYTSLTKCKTCLEFEGYSPGCPCKESENYAASTLFHIYLNWEGIGEKVSFVLIELKGSLPDNEREVYENILLSFEKNNE